MRWNQRIAAVMTAAAAAAAIGTAGLAGPALAAPAAGHHLGNFTSWSAAQKAAGFKLLRPTRTYGHKRNGPIGVSRCEVKKMEAKRVVSVIYGLTPFSMLGLTQNNSGKACTETGKLTRLGTYKVDGAKAVLTGKCGMKGLRPCSSTKIFLFLTWTRHGIYYVATSFGLGRKTLVGFATGLRRV